MMHKTILRTIAICGLLSTIVSLPAGAFSTSRYAAKSRLATGKWVKIAVAEDGMYQLTAKELERMGFQNINNVQIFGMGGHPVSELLNGTYPDDLRQIPAQREGDKLYFYAAGPVEMSLADVRTSTPHYTRAINTSSTLGYYFVTESNTAAAAPQMAAAPAIEAPSQAAELNYRSSCLGYFYHEQESSSMSFAGRQLLGEDLIPGAVTIPYTLDGLSGTDIVVQCAAAAASQQTITENASVSTNGVSYIGAVIRSGSTNIEVPFSTTSSKIYARASVSIYYNTASPLAAVSLPAVTPSGDISVSVTCPLSSLKSARLDNIIISYPRNNVIGSNGQVVMGFPTIASGDRIVLPGASQHTMVWNVTDPNTPVQYTLTNSTEGNGLMFVPAVSATKGSTYVAFDPTQTLKQITSYEAIENQNIHGAEVPDMLIICSAAFKGQAQRVAEMHHRVDGIDVLCVTQEQVFNEFSSGTPDAMAFRMACKMFYDRNPEKFRNLLLFGHGSFDNRGLVMAKPNALLTYEGEVSNNEDRAYVCDDFFGMLDDNSGNDITSAVLRIGVGRITSSSLAEAVSDVDKLEDYLLRPDYGPWRNNTLITSETATGEAGNNGLHEFQAEGVAMILEDELATGMHVDKSYVDMFPRDITQTNLSEENRTATEAKHHISEVLQKGAYFFTYVGHAGGSVFTSKARLWTSPDVDACPNRFLPIVSTACCDVARYDGNVQGISERMFHKRNGGAIALLTSARQVYADNNDLLNCAFVRAMFSGEYATVGEAYMKSKQYWGTTSNSNKLSFLLLGDPAIRIHLPQPRMKITSLNGFDLEANPDLEITIRPMKKVHFTAQVLKDDGTLDTSFNGDAYVTLYDAKRKLTSITTRYNRVMTTREITYPREEIVQVKGRVVNGVFEASFVTPRHIKSITDRRTRSSDAEGVTLTKDYGLLSVYAHQDNSTIMVNGTYDKPVITPYTASGSLVDNAAPVITEMFLNDRQSFAEGAVVPSSSTLVVEATDNQAINTQALSIGNSMKLLLDGGASTYYTIKNYAVVSDEGRTMRLEFPLTDLPYGRHTLTFTVFDAAGNAAERTVTFAVGDSEAYTLQVDERAASTQATFNISGATHKTPLMRIRVTDGTGNEVWTKSTTTFPVTWNLKDKAGNRVPAGIYKYGASYESDDAYGGTPQGNLVVVEDVKSNR